MHFCARRYVTASAISWTSEFVAQIIRNQQHQKDGDEVRDAIHAKINKICGSSIISAVENEDYVKYVPVGTRERIIKLQPVQQDPMRPPPFRLNKVPNITSFEMHLK